MAYAERLRNTRRHSKRNKAEGLAAQVNEPSASFLYLPTFPGLRPEYLESFLDNGIKALVLEGYHSGTINACNPTDKDNSEFNLIPFLEKAGKRKVPVFMTFGDFPVTRDEWRYNFRAFDNLEGLYVTSAIAINAGIVPLRATDQQKYEVIDRLNQVLQFAQDYDVVIDLMYGAFPFAVSLDQMRSHCKNTMGSNR